MSQWVRLWEDMPNDPKWRVIARASGRPITEVKCVFIDLMFAAANATERGRTHEITDEDIGAGNDIDIEFVKKIRAEMQGRVLDGDQLTGWKKRQPLREDSSAERAKAWRERNRTQTNADERPEEKRIDPNTNVFGNARARARKKNNSPNGHGRSNGTEELVRWVLEDLQNDGKRREDCAAEIVPMLQRERR
jgi:hypothetical protein